METKLLNLAVSRLSDELEKLKAEFEEYKKNNTSNKNEVILSQVHTSVSIKDELLDTDEVKTILGVCFNTLQKLVRGGLIKQIRISKRRIKYTKASILEFIKSESK
ncbi:MAG: helix-turn-helix domain-containing protein [Flavobacteriia bacterium]|nr:helix-turn-helix domain-containing protein [Flavobacteriia bacterium]